MQPTELNLHLNPVTSLDKGCPGRHLKAFSLIEMSVVIAILLILMTAGISLMNGTGAQARRAGTDMLTGMLEQARTTAITSRSNVILAIAEPGDLPATDERCRIGLFKVLGEKDWPSNTSTPIEAVLLNRWRTLETGVALIGDDVDGIYNPVGKSADEISIKYGPANRPITIKVSAVAFNPRGGLVHPAGSTPIVFRIAEGAYRNGSPKANIRADAAGPSENRLKVGRVTARPYRIDG